MLDAIQRRIGEFNLPTAAESADLARIVQLDSMCSRLAREIEMASPAVQTQLREELERTITERSAILRRLGLIPDCDGEVRAGDSQDHVKITGENQ